MYAYAYNYDYDYEYVATSYGHLTVARRATHEPQPNARAPGKVTTQRLQL
jgi:hypothetical protein